MATNSEIEQVRRRIGDSLKSNTEIITADGGVMFAMQYKNIDDVVILVDNSKLTDKDYTINQKSGQIVFLTAPTSGSVINITYSYSGYLKADIEALIANYGVDGAVIECLNELLVDSARFYDYSQGQTTDRRSQIFDHLRTLLDKAERDAGIKGGEVVIGKRHPQNDRPVRIREDLSRTDRWSDNNC